MVRRNWVALLTAFAIVGSSLSALPSAASQNCTVTIADEGITWNGTNSSDVVCVTGNYNFINTLGGDDTVIDDGEGNTINLGDGADVYDGETAYASTIEGGAGDDEITGTPGDDEITADDGDDTVVAGEGDDTISGGSGDDNLEGGAGADDIQGEAGTDILVGNAGDDYLSGGTEIDQINGGTGLNICDFTAGEPQTSTCKYDSEGPVLSSTFFTPTIADVGSADVRVEFSFNINDASGLRFGYLNCRKGNLPYISASIWGSTDGRLSPNTMSGLGLARGLSVSEGTPRSASFSGFVVVPKGTAPGDITCSSGMTDFLGNFQDVEDTVAFTILNSDPNADTAAPSLVSMAASPSVVDVSQGSTQNSLSLNFRITDKTGINDGSFWCSNEWASIAFAITFSGSGGNVNRSEYQTTITQLSVSHTGTSKDFSVNAEMQFPIGSKPTSFDCRVNLSDTVGNSSLTLYRGAFYTTRVGEGYDDAAPDLSVEIVGDRSLEVGTGPADLHFVLRASDQNVVKYAYARCINSSNFFDVSVSGASNGQISSYTSNNPTMSFLTTSLNGDAYSLTLEATVRLSAGITPGAYKCYLNTRDLLGNESRVDVPAVFLVFRTPAGQPSAPQSLQFTSDGAGTRTGRLSWDTPVTLGSPSMTEYVAEYSQDQGVTWTLFNTVDKSVTSVPLTGLKANTDYLFRIRGENGGTAGQDENFMSLSWAEISVRTPQALVPTPPRNLAVREIGTTSAVIAFEAPLDDRASTISDLKVEISRDGLNWTQVSSDQSMALSHTVSGLAPGTQYLARVSAANAIGMSDPISTTFMTAKSKASSVLNLMASKVSYTTLSLGWALPASNGGSPITNYVVQYSKNETTWVSVVHNTSIARGINVTGLKPGVDYVFRVAAVTSLGVGSWSDYIHKTTLGNKPSAPKSLSVRPSTTSVVIGWNAALVSNGPPVTNYFVEYSKDNRTWITVKKAVSSSTKLTVTGLKSKTVYRFRVSAVNSIGISTPSAALKFSTR